MSQEVLKAGDEAKRAAAAAAAVTQAGLTETEYRAWQQDMEARLAQLRLVCQMRGLGLSRRPRAGFSQERSGQFWTMAGDEALMCLETFWRNRRWHDLFPHSKPPSLANN